MDNYIRYFKAKLYLIEYTDFENNKKTGFLYATNYIKEKDKLDIVRNKLDENVKSIETFVKVDGYIPIDYKFLNTIDIDYHRTDISW